MVNGVVFFDFDGTLVDESEKIWYPTEKTMEAIRLLKERNYLVFLASGRTKAYIPDVGIDFDGYIASNGAYAEIGGRMIQNIKMDSDLLRELIEILVGKGMCYSMENPDVCYTNGLADEHFIKTLETFNINKNVFVEHKGELECNKLFITYNSKDDEIEIATRFKDRLIIGQHRNNLSSDVDTVGMTKAVGVKAVLNELGIPKEKSYAFGDEVNDYDMFQAVGHGIAMGVHHKKLDEVCEFVTETVKNEGIYCALKKLNII